MCVRPLKDALLDRCRESLHDQGVLGGVLYRGAEMEAEVDRWSCGNIYLSQGWPSALQEIEFNGRSFRLVPHDHRHDLFPAVGLKLHRAESYEDGWTLIARFLSALSWACDGAFQTFNYSGSATGLHPMSGYAANSQHHITFYDGAQGLSSGFRSNSLKAVESEQSFPLACYREGKGLEFWSPRYSFLSYWKIIERANPTSTETYSNHVIKSSRTSAGALDHFALEALRWIELSEQWNDVGKYLRERVRNASAHADAAKKFVPSDPDDIHEQDRLRRCMPLAANIARFCLCDKFGLPKPRDMWQ